MNIELWGFEEKENDDSRVLSIHYVPNTGNPFSHVSLFSSNGNSVR